ncbi:TPR-containing protein [Naegleria gruberi]|uniref:TPR-containing protein n=1 Tax=Naegleria gruberi TaxID=5762 RepID=D2V9S6_NAEGR|nr:TPR-containing protein [Naegleria gruberi]EFC46520.1 TPR-containing protein [Naegleria gruberi]|eukprot:XP_002679264.1 TPR-containing protein [Naegleria gruberi strain NEG-M]
MSKPLLVVELSNERNQTEEHNIGASSSEGINLIYDKVSDEYFVFQDNQEPEDLKYELSLFDKFRSIKDYSNAITSISKCIAKYPNYFYLYYKQGFLFKSISSRSIETIRSCKMALFLASRQRNIVWSLLLSGFIFELDNQFKTASEYYENALKLSNEKTLHLQDLYFRIGMIKGDLEDYVSSMDYFYKSLEIQQSTDPTKIFYMGMCYNNIGWCYKQMENDQKSVEFYEKAIQVCNGTASLFYSNKIKALKKLERIDEAIEHCDAAVKVTIDRSSLSSLYAEKAFLYHLKDQRDLASEYFDLAMKYDEKFYFPYLYASVSKLTRLGTSNQNNRQPNESLTILEKGINICDEKIELVQMLVSIYEFLGDTERGEFYSNKLVQLKAGLLQRIS